MALIEIGRIVRPQGIDGRVKVLSYLESPAVLTTLREVWLGQTAAGAAVYPLLRVQMGPGHVILGLDGVRDRDAAGRLVGVSVWIPRETLPDLPEGEYYWQDLMGLMVLTETGETLGRIEAIFPTGSNDVLVCRAGEREILLPGIGEVVQHVDLVRGVMVVRLLEGLAE